MEIIARKKANLYGIYLACAIIGGLVTVWGAINLSLSPANVLYIPFGVFLSIISIHTCIKVKKTPNEIIKFDGEKLICPDGEFLINEVVNAQSRMALTRRPYWRQKWGKLTLTVKGENHVYDYVEDVEKVQQRIMEIRLQNK